MDFLVEVLREDKPDGSIHLFARGHITTKEANILDLRIDKAFEEEPPIILLDMLGVKFLSSMGIRVLLSAYKRTFKGQTKFKIVNPSENVRNVLGMVALNDLLM
ncbi:MAG: STAS domain-containing protein [Oscillospiraceae bacterium]|nr:STAS domain-containing protein [Oscillospiraceae bacterium]